MGFSTPAVVQLVAAAGLVKLTELLPSAQPQCRRVEITITTGSNPNWTGRVRKSSDGVGWGSEWRVGDVIVQEATGLPGAQVHLEQIWLGADTDGGGIRCNVE